MKKIFIAVLAVAALASCSKEQIVNVDKGEAISFENAFVENATRATDLTTSNLQDFGVYGTVAKGGNTALIFENTRVYKNGDTFKYDVPQYWIAEADYTFTAIAPYTGAKWSYDPETTTLSFNNDAAAEQDVLFAYAAKTTEAELTAQNTQPVAFTFKHILSKVAFKFENTFADGNTTLSIYNVKINNTAKKGTMAINADGVDQAWDDTEDLVVPFGTQSANVNLNKNAAIGNGANLVVNHQYIIPAEREYVITFDVDLYQAGVYLATYNHEIEKTINFAKNGNYSLNIKLAPNTVDPDSQLYPIEFTVEDIDDWDSTNGNVALN